MEYKIHLNTDCFLFMKHDTYLCSKPSKEIAKAEAIRKEYFKNK